MRFGLAFALAAVAALLVLARDAPPAPAATGSVLVVGDSLVIGTTPYLRRELAGASVTSDGRIGRPSNEAVGVLRSKFSGQRIVVFDAGVNDDPAQPSRLSADLAAVRSIAGGRCLVVATMSRPPYRGVSVDGLNRAVRSFASATSNARLVDWRAAAVANPRLINSDGVHPTGAGYQLRARLFVQAIESCGSGGSPGSAPPTSGGLPPPGTPPPRGRRPGRVPGEPPPARKPPRSRPKPPPRLGSQSPVLIDEPVSFPSRGARLSGELLTPAGGGRHPAVVMLHGSGAAVREQYREQGEYLAEHGVAALIYDKRGAGESTGDPDYRYSQLAGDARAAVAFLRGRAEVRPEGIGLWGLSEGGSIAPMVAAGNPQIAAVMAVSPSAIAPASQEEWAVRHSLDAGGAGAGAAAVSRYYAVATDFGDAGLAGGRAADLRFDPAPVWRRVSQPVLAVWGTADRLVPVHDSAAALASALAGGGVNRDRVFRTFQGASHSLGVEAEGTRPGSAPGFKELSAAWLREHLGTKRATPVVSTPLPPASDVPAQPVQRASLLERWPVQLAWLVLPGLALTLLGVREWRRRRRADDEPAPAPPWWWPAGVAGLDLLALCTLAIGVAEIVGVDGQGVAAVAGVPVALLVAWALTLAGAVATALLARRAWRGRERRLRSPSMGVALAGSAWLLLAIYWLV
jgi:uncharacterized protein